MSQYIATDKVLYCQESPRFYVATTLSAALQPTIYTSDINQFGH